MDLRLLGQQANGELQRGEKLGVLRTEVVPLAVLPIEESKDPNREELLNDSDEHIGGDLCVFLRDRLVSFLEFVVDVDEEIGVERVALRELQMRRDDQRARMVLAKQQDRRGRDDTQTVHFLRVRMAAFSDLLEDAAARRNVQRQPVKSPVDRELGVRSASHELQRECGIWRHRIGRRGSQPPSCRSANTSHTRDEGS